jgi:hypothetical protein
MAQVQEEFPVLAAIYELPKFLGVLSMFKEPELEWGDKQVVITAGKQQVPVHLCRSQGRGSPTGEAPDYAGYPGRVPLEGR